jgi:hypothetical protein
MKHKVENKSLKQPTLVLGNRVVRFGGGWKWLRIGRMTVILVSTSEILVLVKQN